MPSKYRIRQKTWNLLKSSFTQFYEDNAIKLSASLSYYTIFSLPPLLVIIIALSSIFFGADAVRGEVFMQIRGFVGNEAALEVQDLLRNVHFSHRSPFAAAIGIVVLVISASGIFAEIQSSINYIWGIKAKPKRGFLKYMKNRLMSFLMVLALGILLIMSLFLNSSMDIMSDKLSVHLPRFTLYLFYVLNLAAVFLIITLLFGLIFKTLPDGRVHWKDALIGSSITALFFMLGKIGMGAFLGRSSFADTYGTAQSIVLILLWVYYSAIILYWGAEFTKVYALAHGKKIIPNAYSVRIDKSQPEIQGPHLPPEQT